MEMKKPTYLTTVEAESLLHPLHHSQNCSTIGQSKELLIVPEVKATSQPDHLVPVESHPLQAATKICWSDKSQFPNLSERGQQSPDAGNSQEIDILYASILKTSPCSKPELFGITEISAPRQESEHISDPGAPTNISSCSNQVSEEISASHHRLPLQESLETHIEEKQPPVSGLMDIAAANEPNPSNDSRRLEHDYKSFNALPLRAVRPKGKLPSLMTKTNSARDSTFQPKILIMHENLHVKSSQHSYKSPDMKQFHKRTVSAQADSHHSGALVLSNAAFSGNKHNTFGSFIPHVSDACSGSCAGDSATHGRSLAAFALSTSTKTSTPRPWKPPSLMADAASAKSLLSYPLSKSRHKRELTGRLSSQHSHTRIINLSRRKNVSVSRSCNRNRSLPDHRLPHEFNCSVKSNNTSRILASSAPIAAVQDQSTGFLDSVGTGVGQRQAVANPAGPKDDQTSYFQLDHKKMIQNVLPPCSPKDMSAATRRSLSLRHHALKKELERLREIQQCPICLDATKELALGCGHQFCCNCGMDFTDCPICRKAVKIRIKLF